MKLRAEVLRRVLLAKSILAPALASSWQQPSDHVIAKQMLEAHDAADLVFAAIADQQGKLPAQEKAPSMIKCLEVIATDSEKHVGYFNQLNAARNSLKHTGNLPNTNQWANVAQEVFTKLSDLCKATLEKSFEEVDEAELLNSEEARACFRSAQQAQALRDFKLALEELGKTLFITLEASSDFWEIEVGVAKATDALKLTAVGVPASDFLKLQEFLPNVSRFGPDPFNIYWRQSKFGHPANWQHDTVDYCAKTCLKVALGIQNAPWTPQALRFDHLYRYKVTATKDNVEVWEDLIENHLTEDSSGSRPFREFHRYLKKGESIIVPAGTSGFVSEDLLPPRNEAITRVIVSDDTPWNALGLRSSKAEFVNLDDVTLTCVPKELWKERFPSLQEIPWQEDPRSLPSEDFSGLE